MDKELQEWHDLHKVHFYSGSYETKDLADFLRVNSRTIQRWLKGKTQPSKEQLKRIKLYLVQKSSEVAL